MRGRGESEGAELLDSTGLEGLHEIPSPEDRRIVQRYSFSSREGPPPVEGVIQNLEMRIAL